MNDAPKFATPIPQHYAQALREAAQWPPELRVGRIDALTKQLAAQAFVRGPGECDPKFAPMSAEQRWLETRGI